MSAKQNLFSSSLSASYKKFYGSTGKTGFQIRATSKEGSVIQKLPVWTARPVSRVQSQDQTGTRAGSKPGPELGPNRNQIQDQTGTRALTKLDPNQDQTRVQGKEEPEGETRNREGGSRRREGGT